MGNDLGSQPAIVIFDKGRGEACGVAPVGVADPTFFAPITKAQREAGGVRALATNDAGEMVAPDGTVGGVPVVAEVNELTGGNAFIESLVRQLDGIIVGAITRDENGAALSSAVKFPDGVTGVYTALVVSADFPGAVDSYSVTYGDQTYTQPTVTRDVSGVVTNRPPLEVA